MFIVQIVGLFECATELEAHAMADKCGTVLTDATQGDKGVVYAKVEQKDAAAGVMDFAEGVVAATRKAAN